MEDKSKILVGEVTRTDIPLDSLINSNSVFKTFTENRHLLGIPVVDGSGVPTGLVMREDFFGKIATQYGTAVYVNRPISLLMKKTPILIDFHISITEAAEIVLVRRDGDLYDYLIVTKNGKYYGVITIRDLLERLLERQC